MNISQSSGPHDWASPEYVRFWAERTDREEAERHPRFHLMAYLVPYPKDAPIAILDLGAGYGALTDMLLEHFPAARAACLDGSPAMLAMLKTRQGHFKERITPILATYDQPGWTEALAGEHFDAVVSSHALHGLGERRSILYREVYAVLKPGGCFLNIDLVPTSTKSLSERFRDVQIRRRIRRQEVSTGIRPGYEEVAASLDCLYPGKSQLPHHSNDWGVGDWTEDLRWLNEAGFVDVDCFWKELRICLLGGYKD